MQKFSILLCSLLLAASAWAGSKADPGKQAIVLEEFVFMKSPTRDCHASSIMELSDGTLLCTWFGGTRERAKDVKIWLARKPKGGTWQEPVAIADGEGGTVFNPVLVQLKGGDIQIYYLCPTIDEGRVITSSDNGLTWSRPVALPKGFVGPVVNKPVYLDDGTIVAGACRTHPASAYTWSAAPTTAAHGPRRRR